MRWNSGENLESASDGSDSSSESPRELRLSVEAPHRDRHEALIARRRALAREHEEASRAVARRERIERHLEVIDDELRASAAPLIESIAIDTPCRARWDDMVGSDVVRHCTRCDRDVHDLSRMTRGEVHELLARAVDTPCVRLRRRPDGRVVTADCPPPERKLLPRAIACAAAGAALGITASGLATMALEATTLGAMRVEHRASIGDRSDIAPPDVAAPDIRMSAFITGLEPLAQDDGATMGVPDYDGAQAPLPALDLDRDVRWTAPQSWEVRRALIERVLAAPASMRGAPRILPRERDGRVVGVALYGIRRADLLGRLGLQNGDTVLDINGYELTQPDSALEAYTQLRTAPSYFVRLERHGRERLHVYRVVP